MEEKDILNFKKHIASFSTEELKNLEIELQNEISRMVLNSDNIVKIAIITALLKAREN